jgi:hypothetical protein
MTPQTTAIALTAEQLDAIRIIARAAWFKGPAGTSAYIIAPERMAILQQILATVR